MKRRTIVLAVVGFGFAAATYCLAADAYVGTWTLNLAKSKYSPGPPPKSSTAKYEIIGDQVQVTVDTVNAVGTSVHYTWTGKFDGKDYPITGDPERDMRAYKRINDHTLEMTNKKAGKVTTTEKIVVSRDGKSRTVTTTGTNAKGQKVKNTAVYEKQ